MRFTLHVWRQNTRGDTGRMVEYPIDGVAPDMSFLEMLDVLNEGLIAKGEEPVAFDHDCREGICGACSMYINGRPHGPKEGITTCQLHMRSFNDGDIVVDRSAFDRIQASGGFVSVNTGNAQDANNIPVSKQNADEAFMAAACIG